MKINQDTTRQIANVIAVVAAFGVNILANLAPIGGMTLGEISQGLFRNVLITPADYAFSIWGLIYLGLFAFAIYQALPSQRDNPELRRLGYWLVVSSCAQILWVFLFQLRFFTGSLVAMLLILLPLIRIYSQLRIGERDVSRKQRWLVHFPLTIYLPWISVATILNGAITLTDLGWNGGILSPQVWTAIMMVVGCGIAIPLSFQRADVPFAAVFLWAIIAIVVRHLELPIISVTGIVLAILLTLLILFNLQRRFPKTQ
jgi:hypothetical protein